MIKSKISCKVTPVILFLKFYIAISIYPDRNYSIKTNNKKCPKPHPQAAKTDSNSNLNSKPKTANSSSPKSLITSTIKPNNKPFHLRLSIRSSKILLTIGLISMRKVSR